MVKVMDTWKGEELRHFLQTTPRSRKFLAKTAKEPSIL